MKKLIIIILTVLSSNLKSYSQSGRIFDFLHNDASARSAAMGGATLTVIDDPTMLHYNPALINTIISQQVSFCFFKHLLDINSGTLFYGNNFEGIGKLGAGVNYTNYGSFKRIDKNGVIQGDFGANDLAFTIGYGTYLNDEISVGLSSKLIFSNIDNYSTSAIALDGGLFYQDTLRRLQVGVSILNLGTQLSKINDKSEDLPIDLRVGVSHQLKGLPLFVALNFTRLLDNNDEFFNRFSYFNIGGEFKISNPIRLRFGYNNKVRSDVSFGESKELAGFSGGFGLIIQEYRIDYGFNSFSRLGSLHRISINVKL
jgi:hypothetical protein